MYLDAIRELFFKLKDHPSAVATWLVDIVNESNDRKAIPSSDNTIHPAIEVESNNNEKQATLEEAGDSSFLL